MKLKILLALCLAAFLAAPAASQKLATKRAPDFSLPDISGKSFKLSENYGRGPIYISFWATWCKPCLEELKIMEKVYEKYKDQGFRMVAINTEGPKAAAKVKSFVKTYGITYDVLVDNDGEVFRRTFKGANMPYTILTNSEGHILFSGVGFKPGDEVEIEKLIAANILAPETAPETQEPEIKPETTPEPDPVTEPVQTTEPETPPDTTLKSE